MLTRGILGVQRQATIRNFIPLDQTLALLLVLTSTPPN